MKLHRLFPTGLVAVAAGLALAAPVRADRTINFESTLEAVNQQSNGTPIDESFTFELGTFRDGFLPLEENTADWLYYWQPAPNSNKSEYSGSTVTYSTEPVPFGGPANAYQGFITLASNDAPFAAGTQAYFWGFNQREAAPLVEWILLTNDNWKIPTVVPGEIEISDLNWLSSDKDTFAVLGAVNPDYDPGVTGSAQTPHLTFQPVAVPEPSAALLALPALLLLSVRRRPSASL